MSKSNFVMRWWNSPSSSSDARFLQVFFGFLFISFIVSVVWLSRLVAVVLLLFCCVMIAFLVRGILSRDEKVFLVRRVLLRVAFGKCHCPLPEDDESTCRARGAIVDDGIIISDPTEPENVGKPIGKGYCDVCEARGVLEQQFPRAIEHRIREYQYDGLPLPEDLVNSLEAHQAKPQ